MSFLVQRECTSFLLIPRCASSISEVNLAGFRVELQLEMYVGGRAASKAFLRVEFITFTLSLIFKEQVLLGVGLNYS